MDAQKITGNVATTPLGLAGLAAGTSTTVPCTRGTGRCPADRRAGRCSETGTPGRPSAWPLLLTAPLGPARLRRVPGDLATPIVRERFQPPLPADPPTLSSHLGHNLRDERKANRSRRVALGRLGLYVSDGFQDHPPSVLNGVQPRLANTFWHALTVACLAESVKHEPISNRPTTDW
jgi:hypothetical protein